VGSRTRLSTLRQPEYIVVCSLTHSVQGYISSSESGALAASVKGESIHPRPKLRRVTPLGEYCVTLKKRKIVRRRGRCVL
jgi:hypothetical protein